MATPASHYTPSARVYHGLEELDYPFHDWTAIVTGCGRICYQRRKINLSQVFAGQKVGQDDETCRLEPIADPFGPRVSPMSPE